MRRAGDAFHERARAIEVARAVVANPLGTLLDPIDIAQLEARCRAVVAPVLESVAQLKLATRTSQSIVKTEELKVAQSARDHHSLGRKPNCSHRS